MKIINYKKKGLSLYELFFDNHPKIVLYEDVIIRHNLLSKKELSLEEINQLISDNEPFAAYYQALKYITTKLRSKQEIYHYLKKKLVNENIINETITKLEKEGYLNENIYCQSFINDQLNLTLNGPQKIKQELLNKGLDEQIFSDQLLTLTDDFWQKRIKKIIEKRLKLNRDSGQQFYLKTTQYLNSLGYEKEQYQELLNAININDDQSFIKTADKYYQKYANKYHGTELELKLKNSLYQKGYRIEQINDYLNKK